MRWLSEFNYTRFRGFSLPTWQHDSVKDLEIEFPLLASDMLSHTRNRNLWIPILTDKFQVLGLYRVVLRCL